jgi:hypothetical protein
MKVVSTTVGYLRRSPTVSSDAALMSRKAAFERPSVFSAIEKRKSGKKADRETGDRETEDRETGDRKT